MYIFCVHLKMAEQMRENVATLLKGIDRYNPENLNILERYVGAQAAENTYDLEANLAVLKLYQFNPVYYQPLTVSLILLKALTNLPHSDFTMCKCLIDAPRLLTVAGVISVVSLLPDELCVSDSLPTCVLKDELAPFVEMVQLFVPTVFEAALVSPLLKKPELHPPNVKMY